MSIVKESCTVCSCSPECSCWRLERDSVKNLQRDNVNLPRDKEARGTSILLSKGRSTLVSNNVNAAWNDLDIPCLRCRCKLSVEVLCDHCQAHLAIKRKLKSFERESIQTQTESVPGPFKAIKKITAEKILLSPKSKSQVDDYSLLKRKIAREFSETSISHDKIKLHFPFLPKVKTRSGIVQGSKLTYSKKPGKVVEVASDDSVITSFITSFPQPEKKKDVQSVSQIIKKIHGYGTPVSSTELRANTLENERVKHYKKLHPSKKRATGDESYLSKTKTKKEPKKNAKVEKDVGFRIKAKEESGLIQKRGQQEKDDKSRDKIAAKDKAQETRTLKDTSGQVVVESRDEKLEKDTTQGKQSRDANEKSGQKEKDGEGKEGGQLEKDTTQGKESRDANEKSGQKEKVAESKGGQLEKDTTQGKEFRDANEKSGQKEKDGESKEGGQLEKDKTQGKESRDAKEQSGQKVKDGKSKEGGQLEKDTIQGKESRDTNEKSGQKEKDGERKESGQLEKDTTQGKESRDASEKSGQKEKDGKSKEGGQLEKDNTLGKELRDAKEKSGQKEKDGKSKEGGQLEKDTTQGKESRDANEKSGQKEKDGESKEGGQLEKDKTHGKESRDAKENSGQKEKDGKSKEGGQLEKDTTQGKESRDANEKSGQKEKDGGSKEGEQLEKVKTQGKESRDANEKSGQKEKDGGNKEGGQLEKDKTQGKESRDANEKSGHKEKDGESKEGRQLEKDKTQSRDAKEKSGQKEKDGKSKEGGQLEKDTTQGKESRDANEKSGQKEKDGESKKGGQLEKDTTQGKESRDAKKDGESKEGGQLEKDTTQGKESGDAKEKSGQKQKDGERKEGGQLEKDKTQGKESGDTKEKSGQKQKDGERKEVGQLEKDKTQGKESGDTKEKSGQKQKDGERKEGGQQEKGKTQGKESRDAKEKSGQKEESVPNEKEEKEHKTTQTENKKSKLPPPPPPRPPPPPLPKAISAQKFQDVDEEETETVFKGKTKAKKAKKTKSTKSQKTKRKQQKADKVIEKKTEETETQEKYANEKFETDKKLVLKKKPERMNIVRPDVVMYDIVLPAPEKKDFKKGKPVEKLPELLTTFPTAVEPDLESLQKILNKKAMQDEEFVKQTTIVKNLPENHDILEKREPNSQICNVSHQFKKSEFRDEYSIEEVVKRRSKVIQYALSDRSYIQNGWTQLPTEKVVRKMFVYRTRPAQPEFDWFKNNQKKGTMFYDTGEKLAEINNKGYGRWYYKNGCIALDYHHTKNEASQDRVVVYSNGEPDEEGRKYPVTCLAMFDFMGNGIVYDHNGRIRINYNQTEGMVHDQKIGPASHWKWHSLNDPPLLQTVMVDTFSEKKDPNILNLEEFDNEIFEKQENQDVYDFELENFSKEVLKRQSKKLSTFQIRTKTVKINQQFSLRILEQSRINLQFREGTTDIKMNLGIIIDSQKIVDTDLVDFGPIPNCMLAQATTKSMTLLQQKYNEVKKINLKRSMHENRVRNPMPISSADRMLSGATRPLHLVPPHAHPLVCACPQPHTCLCESL